MKSWVYAADEHSSNGTHAASDFATVGHYYLQQRAARMRHEVKDEGDERLRRPAGDDVAAAAAAAAAEDAIDLR